MKMSIKIWLVVCIGLLPNFVQAQCAGTTRAQNAGIAWPYSIYFITEKVGWLAGAGNTLRTTLDGGETWQSVKPPKGADGNIRTVYFADDYTGFIGTATGGIGKTTNGGDTWFALNSGVTKMIRHIFAINTENIWGVGDRYTIVHSSNGGTTWTQPPIPVDSSNLQYPHYGCIYFLKNTKPNVGFLGGNHGNFFKTIDGGLTWKKLTAADDSSFVTSVNFVNDSLGYAVGGDGLVMKTLDGGDTWAKIPTTFNNMFKRVQAISKDTVYASGIGIFVKSVDGGQTWNPIYYGNSQDLTYLHFPTKRVGYLCGNNATFIKITHDNAPPTAAFIENGTSLIASSGPGYQYQWLKDNAIIPGANTGIYEPTETGAYQVQVKLNDCQTVSEAKLIVVTPTGLIKPVANTNMQVYPNPASSNLNITYTGSYHANQLWITNQLGQIVYANNTIPATKQTLEIPISGLVPGIYQVTLQTSQALLRQKLVIQ